MKALGEKTFAMIDLETLAISQNAAIISIGAVQFNMDGVDEVGAFYHRIALGSLDDFDQSDNTMQWWSRQDAAVREEAFSGTEGLIAVLSAFSKWYIPGTIAVGNGANFDLSILANAHEFFGLDLPWHYRDTFCFRSLRMMYPEIVDDSELTKHNALNDAIRQAEHMIKIYHSVVPLTIG